MAFARGHIFLYTLFAFFKLYDATAATATVSTFRSRICLPTCLRACFRVCLFLRAFLPASCRLASSSIGPLPFSLFTATRYIEFWNDT